MLALLLVLMSAPAVSGGAHPPSPPSATGFFHAQQLGDLWWIIDPAGKRFLSLGVTGVRMEGDTIRGTNRQPYLEACEAKYGSREAWSAASLKFIKSLGFNTLGSWCADYLWDCGVPYTVILNIAASSGANWQAGRVADLWSPRFEQTADDICARLCKPRAGSHQLIGYYLDNELRWGPDWRAGTTYLEEYLMMPVDAPGHAKAVEFVRAHYKTVADLNAAWKLDLADWSGLDSQKFTSPYRTPAAWADGKAFVGLAARRYFEVCQAAIHRSDPNHMNLGCRDDMASSGLPVAEASRGLVDVFSVNYYVPRAFAPPLKMLYEASRAPILITEWSFRSRDSGLPNTIGAGPVVDTQTDRAEKYREYMTDLLAQPYVVGAHWFEWVDEPAEGRFDGENSNYGLVNIHDDPYTVFDAAVKQVNLSAFKLHTGGKP